MRISYFLLSLIALSVGMSASAQSPTLLQRGDGKAVSEGKISRSRMDSTQVPRIREELPTDPHSYARPNEASITNLRLRLAVDLDRRVIKGEAEYRFHRKGTNLINLDAKGLRIESVTDQDGNELRYKLSPPDSVLGSALSVILDEGTSSFLIKYSTTPQSDALQWLTSEQNDGEGPFLFTQGQAILTRTWIPIQDSPGIRFTWSAEVTVPKGMVALMSAQGNQTSFREQQAVFNFKMPKPVPAYLMALAVGNIAYKRLSDRTGIYARPGMIERAYQEFRELPRMLEEAERLCGPYEWDRYCLLVMPSAFPFGGMENPMLSFISPTVVAGDRSLVSVVAHELAHSWAGNLVTCATWDGIWLNEGWTVYLERRLVESIYGRDVADMMEVLGFQELMGALQELPEGHADRSLNPKLEGRDPDDGMSEVAYERGALVLRDIESAWGRDRFDRFIHTYFKEFRWRHMTTARFIAFVEEYAKAMGLPAIDLQGAAADRGIPAPASPLRSERLEAVEKAKQRLMDGDTAALSAIDAWSAQERQYLLRILPQRLDAARLSALSMALGQEPLRNAEVRFQWLMLRASSEDASLRPDAEAFLREVGRRKFVYPLFKELMRHKHSAAWAKPFFLSVRDRYHSLTAGSVAALME